MDSGGRLVAALAAIAVAVALLAGGADADCFDYSYKNCISNDKSMADYCNYACGKTCDPGLRQQRPLAAAVGDRSMRCQIDCVRRSCTGFRKDRKGVMGCYQVCFDGCKIKTAKMEDAVRPASEPDPFRAASVPDHPFHEKQDAVQPAALPDHPFHEKQDAVRPTSEPYPFRVASVPDHPFHEKQDAVRPTSEPYPFRAESVPDHPFHEKQDAVQPAALPDHPSHEKQDAVEPSTVPTGHP